MIGCRRTDLLEVRNSSATHRGAEVSVDDTKYP